MQQLNKYTCSPAHWLSVYLLGAELQMTIFPLLLLLLPLFLLSSARVSLTNLQIFIPFV